MRHPKRKHGGELVNNDLCIGTSTDTSSTAESDIPIKAGNIVACYLEKYQDEEPQLAKILEVNFDKVQVQWLKGSYYDPWSPCELKKGSTYEPWVEQIPRTSILYQVYLSKAARLTEPCKKKLKLSYSKL